MKPDSSNKPPAQCLSSTRHPGEWEVCPLPTANHSGVEVGVGSGGCWQVEVCVCVAVGEGGEDSSGKEKDKWGKNSVA